MASSTSVPAPRSRSKKPLGKMAGEWTQTPNSRRLPGPQTQALERHREADRVGMGGGPGLTSVPTGSVGSEGACIREASVLVAHRFPKCAQLVFPAWKPLY